MLLANQYCHDAVSGDVEGVEIACSITVEYLDVCAIGVGHLMDAQTRVKLHLHWSRVSNDLYVHWKPTSGKSEWVATAFHVKRSNAKSHGRGEKVVRIKVVFDVDTRPFILLQLHAANKLQEVLGLEMIIKIIFYMLSVILIKGKYLIRRCPLGNQIQSMSLHTKLPHSLAKTHFAAMHWS